MRVERTQSAVRKAPSDEVELRPVDARGQRSCLRERKTMVQP